MRTLEEAIAYFEENAKRYEGDWQICPRSEQEPGCKGDGKCPIFNGEGCMKLAEECTQIAEWLKELKELKESSDADTISRDAVLDKIKEVCFSNKFVDFRVDYGHRGQIDYLINSIQFDLPSVRSTRAKWVNDRCSQCGEKALKESYYGVDGVECDTVHSNYCPNCGAKMKG